MSVETIDKAEEQIREKQKAVDYDIKEFTVEIMVLKYLKGGENDENEIYIPDYQRAFVWKQDQQSRLIESLILGLPIPYIFTAEMPDGRLEIVDGSQRIRTLAAFINNGLILKDLDILKNLEGYTFDNLSISRRRKFLNTSLRMIVLTEKSDEDVRFMLFERINSGSTLLKDMEKRRGAFSGKFTKFIDECAQKPLFRKLTGFTEQAKKRREPEELILRFFAYSDNYKEFKNSVIDFLNDYNKEKNENFNREELENRFESMLNFVDKNFPHGFIKSPGSQKTPRLRFEAISVGVYLALKEEPNLAVNNFDWLDSNEFIIEISGSSTNSPKKLMSRIEFVKNRLLEGHLR